MKLSLGKDLAPIKAEAARRIDAKAEASARSLSACPTIHAVKVMVGERHPAIVREAADRGISPVELVEAIDLRAREAAIAILEIDAQRLARKRAVAAATSEQDIRAILAAL